MGPKHRSSSINIYKDSAQFHFTEPEILGVSKQLGIKNKDRVRDCLAMFIEELYKIQREIRNPMKASFIESTKAYQLNLHEWMDRQHTVKKRDNLSAMLKELKQTHKHLSEPGHIQFDYRFYGHRLAQEIKDYLANVDRAKTQDHQPKKGGRFKNEYLLLLVHIADFLSKNDIKIYPGSPTLEQLGKLASIMSELAQQCPPLLAKKNQERIWDLTIIDENILGPLWQDIISGKSNYKEIKKEWDPKNYSTSFVPIHISDPPLWGLDGPKDTEEKPTKGFRFGFIDRTGKEIVPPTYDWVLNFTESLAAVELDGRWGFINTKGELVIPLGYDDVSPFHDGLAAVRLGGKTGFINKKGKVVIPLKYEIGFMVDGGLAVVELDGKTQWLNKKGKEVVFPEGFRGGFFDGLAIMWLDNKCGFIDTTGELVIPPIYQSASVFSGGLAAVGLDNKYGFIDTTGELVIPLRYDWVGGTHDGLTGVLLNDVGFLIDRQGNEFPVEDAQQESKNYVLPEFEHIHDFSEGLAAVNVGSKWGFIDPTGKFVIPLAYDYIGPFSHGLAPVRYSYDRSATEKINKVARKRKK